MAIPERVVRAAVVFCPGPWFPWNLALTLLRQFSAPYFPGSIKTNLHHSRQPGYVCLPLQAEILPNSRIAGNCL